MRRKRCSVEPIVAILKQAEIPLKASPFANACMQLSSQHAFVATERTGKAFRRSV